MKTKYFLSLFASIGIAGAAFSQTATPTAAPVKTIIPAEKQAQQPVTTTSSGPVFMAKPSEAPPPDNPNAAEISFTKELHDFGTIDQGANGTTEFTFKNTGKEPLIISDAKGSCGCTVPSYPKEPIKPGANGTIKVTYDTKRVGAFSKTVTITSNSKSGNKMLTIKGNVKAVSDEETFPAKKVTSGTPVEGH